MNHETQATMARVEIQIREELLHAVPYVLTAYTWLRMQSLPGFDVEMFHRICERNRWTLTPVPHLDAWSVAPVDLAETMTTLEKAKGKNVCMPESITDWLEQHGYTVNSEKQRFESAQYFIPFTEIRGHTVASFKETAARKGWVVPQETGGLTGLVATS